MLNHITSVSKVKQGQLANLAQTDGITMTSREIAMLCKKEHSHVMRDTRLMLDELGIDQSSFGSVFLDTYNREQPCLGSCEHVIVDVISDSGEVSLNLEEALRKIDQFVEYGRNRILSALSFHFDLEAI